MLSHTKHTTLESTRMLNAFVLFRAEGMSAVRDMYPEYRDFVEQHKENSVRQVKKLLFPSPPSRQIKAK